MTIISIANYSFNDFLTDGISLSRELKEVAKTALASGQAEICNTIPYLVCGGRNYGRDVGQLTQGNRHG